MPPFPSRNVTDRAPRNQPKDGPGGQPFWRTKTLEEMSSEEWESLCDGCALCCLVKLEDEDTGEIHKTDIACKLLDSGACRCRSYARRQEKVDDCLKLTPESVRELTWLPKTCAYRLVARGEPLAEWHPLVSGSAQSVHDAGISARGRTRGSERTVRLRDYVDHIVDWGD